MREEKKESILKLGINSPYWNEFADRLYWDNESTESKLYLAGTLSGFSPDYVFQVMREQSSLHGTSFVNLGFFYWNDFFKGKKNNSTSNNASAQVMIQVREISLAAYERVALNARDRFREIFLEDGQLDIEFLKAIHFNATRSMSTAEVALGSDMDGFITGTLDGCIGAGKDAVFEANKSIIERGED